MIFVDFLPTMISCHVSVNTVTSLCKWFMQTIQYFHQLSSQCNTASTWQEEGKDQGGKVGRASPLSHIQRQISTSHSFSIMICSIIPLQHSVWSVLHSSSYNSSLPSLIDPHRLSEKLKPAHLLASVAFWSVRLHGQLFVSRSQTAFAFVLAVNGKRSL